MKRLPSAVIVQARPRSYRPAIIKLPIDGAHAAPAISSPMLHAVSHGLRLKQLRDVQQRIEGLRIQEIFRDAIENFAVASGIFLMGFHDGREDVAVALLGKLLHRLQRRERLEPEFRAETEEMLAIFRERLAAVPYLPVMHIAFVLRVRLLEAATGGRRSQPVERIRVHSLGHRRKQNLELLNIIRTELGAFGEIPIHPRLLHLIIAAPNSERGMMPNPLDVILHFSGNFLGEALRHLIFRAGEQMILPHDQTILIAQLVEIIVGIEASAPYSNAIEVRVDAIANEPPGSFLAMPSANIVLRNIIGAHRKDGMTVHFNLEGLAPPIRLLLDRQRTKSNFEAPLLEQIRPAIQSNPRLIQGLLAQAVRPP